MRSSGFPRREKVVSCWRIQQASFINLFGLELLLLFGPILLFLDEKTNGLERICSLGC